MREKKKGGRNGMEKGSREEGRLGVKERTREKMMGKGMKVCKFLEGNFLCAFRSRNT